MIIQPWHIATRGRFGAEYGIATRGYIVCPPLVARMPVSADVIPEKLFGVITEEELEAVLRDCGWVGELDLAKFGLDAAWQATSTLFGEITGENLLEAVIDARDPLVGLVTVLDDAAAQLAASGTVGEVDASDGGATATASSLTGSLEEKPGEGACGDGDAEPC